MSKELVISATRHETRVAVLEEDQLVEIFYQREKEYSLAGSIHKGRVTRVLPGMQSAFVDIGLERDAFLYVSDFFEDNEEYDKIVTGVEEKVLRLEKGLPLVDASVTLSAEPNLEVEQRASEAEPVSPVASFSQRDPRPDRSGDRGVDRQRGGRGRRRGRRGPGMSTGSGNPGGGLPESKYFSPRERPLERESRETTQDPGVSSESAISAGEMVVLPGESLAKYIADAPATVQIEMEEENLRFEPNPFETLDAPEEEAEPESAFPEVIGHEELEPGDGIHALQEEKEAETESQTIANQDDESIASEEEEEEQDEDLPEAIGLASEGEEPSSEPDTEEGPEPARTPTSLTATLREQNPRYQHRVSRRMRRKTRSGGPVEERTARPAQTGEPSAPDLNGNLMESDAPGIAEPSEIRQPREIRPPREGRGPREDRPRESREPREREERQRPPLPSITDLLREGQEIIVQIAKEPLGQKGARITSHVALPGRFLVYMPSVDHIGVSRKIPSDDERQRLKRVLQTHRTGIPGGFIVRTAGDGRTEEELRADMMFLYNLWLDMRQKAEKRPAPQLMHHDLDVVQRILRDQLTSAFKTVWVDNEMLYESILGFVQRFQPALVSRIKLYTRPMPIFDEFGITSELEKALRPKVWLKSGGYIVINQTEALVAIDINTGKYVGKSNRLEDTIVKTNTDAIKEIVRQIRLRDLGGIIVVDFIDMDERKNKQKVMQALEEAMRVDRAPYKILQFNDFGLVAITRKRVKQSLERTLCAPCPYCEGAGSVKSVQTVITEILIEAQKMSRLVDGTDVMLRVHPEVAKVLKSNQNDFLQEIEETLGKTVMVKSDPLLHQTKFDLA